MAEALLAKMPVVLRRFIVNDWKEWSVPIIADFTNNGIKGTNERT